MEKYVKWILLALTVFGFIVCIPIFCFQLAPSDLPITDPSQDTAQITKFIIHVGSDANENTIYSLDVTFVPTATTKPDQGYHIIVNTTFIKITYDVQWNQSELTAGEPKALSAVLSNDQYLVLMQEPQYSLVIYEWKPKYDFSLILPWIITLALYLGLIIYRVIKPAKAKKKKKARKW